MSHYYYWCGDAVIALFLRGRHCDFLMGLLAKCRTVNTAACTVTEFHLAVAQATKDGKLKPHGGEALRKAFDDAIRLERIVLIPEDSARPGDELTYLEIRSHLAKINPITVMHLTAAKQHGFRCCVTCQEQAVALSRIWGLRPVTPALAVKEELLDPYRNSLARIRDLFAAMEPCCEELSYMDGDMEAAAKVLATSLTKLDPHTSAKRMAPIEEACESFFDVLDRIQHEVHDANDALSEWETAAENVAAKVDPDDSD